MTSEVDRGKRIPRVLLVGMYANRDWILGNWLREIKARGKNKYRIYWLHTVYGQKRLFENFLTMPLPKADMYFFSYPTMFRHYLGKEPKRYTKKSIVLYTHNEAELGGIAQQVDLLNQAFRVHFASPLDRDTLVRAGLNAELTRLVYGAIDDECLSIEPGPKKPNSVLLASRYSTRKGLDVLPDVVNSLPNFSFTALGVGWDRFVQNSSLGQATNFKLLPFNFATRNTFMKDSQIFLSLSILEGGPIPLLEAINFGCIPVATDTGFSREFIIHSKNGFIIPTKPTTDLVVSAINQAGALKPNSLPESVRTLTWDRVTKIVDDDVSLYWLGG